MSLKPVLYDFKRSVLRISTLVILAIAIAGGLLLTYGIYSSLQSGGANPLDVNFMGALIVAGDSAALTGLVFDSRGNPLGDVEATLYWNNTEILKARSDENGFIKATARIQDLRAWIQMPGQPGAIFYPPVIRLETREGSVNATLVSAEINQQGSIYSFRRASPQVIGTNAMAIRSSTTAIAGPGVVVTVGSQSTLGATVSQCSPQGNRYIYIGSLALSRINGYLDVVVYGFNVDLTDLSIKPLEGRLLYNITSYDTLYGLARSTPEILRAVCDASKYSLRDLGDLSSYWGRYRAPLPGNLGSGVILIGLGDQRGGLAAVSIGGFQELPPAIIAMATQLPISLQLITPLFTIAIVFLGNSLIARPRGGGELEFILSRPLTRRDLFVNRYLAGIFTLVAMVAIYTLTIAIASNTLIKITYNPLYMFTMALGVLLSLATFFSLLYSVAASIRPSWYLGTGIAIYILFVIMWGAIPWIVGFLVLGYRDLQQIISLSRTMSYFNPLVANEYFTELVQKQILGETLRNAVGGAELNPIFVAISTAAWTILPLLLAYLRFRKTPLYT